MDGMLETVEESNVPLEEAENRIKAILKNSNGRYLECEIIEKARLTQKLGLTVVIPSLLRKHEVRWNRDEKLVLIPNGGNGSAKTDPPNAEVQGADLIG